MFTWRVVLGRDLIVLTTYMVLIVGLVVSEQLASPAIAARWTYTVGSAAYAFFVIRNHWVAGKSGEVGQGAFVYPVTCVMFVVGGILLGLVAGVNLKFLMGLPI